MSAPRKLKVTGKLTPEDPLESPIRVNLEIELPESEIDTLAILRDENKDLEQRVAEYERLDDLRRSLGGAREHSQRHRAD